MVMAGLIKVKDCKHANLFKQPNMKVFCIAGFVKPVKKSKVWTLTGAMSANPREKRKKERKKDSSMTTGSVEIVVDAGFHLDELFF